MALLASAYADPDFAVFADILWFRLDVRRRSARPVKSAFIKALLILFVPFLLGISFEQAALRADYERAWSPRRPSVLPFWRNQLSGAVRGFFPADYYPAFPTLVRYVTGFGVLAIALSYGLVIALTRRFPSVNPFLLTFVSLALLLGAALHLGRIATIHHVFHS